MDDIRLLITEQRNKLSTNIDQKTTEEILNVINLEDQTVPHQIQKEIPSIVKVVDLVVEAFQNGGRLFYVGAGTSGRIGTLDASECPPTYGTPPEMVQAIIAGGERAVFHAIEGAEDSEELGRRDICESGVNQNDVVIGISASGRAPYVIGALKEAQACSAVAVSFTCNKNAEMNGYAKFNINVEVGPEVVMGSTRMKAGTAQKLVLNMISTTAMIQLGKVYDNLMIDLQPLNKKLVERSKKIIQDATGCSEAEAERLFEESKRNPKSAIIMYLCKTSYEKSKELLEKYNGKVHLAIKRFESQDSRKEI